MKYTKRRSRLFLPPKLPLILLVPALFSGCGGNGGGTIGGNPCKPPNETPSQFVVVLFDISGSTGTDAARSRYRQGFETLLGAFTQGRALHGKESTVAVGAIDASTKVSFDPLQCTYPEKGSGTNPLVHRTRIDKVQEGLTKRAYGIIDGPRDETGTAIIDALDGVSRLLGRHYEAEGKYLVLFSDMVEESERGRRLSQADCSRLAGATDAKLDGVKGYVVGAGVSTKRISSERVDQVRKFWTCYFQALGGELARANYGPTLLGFP